LRRRSAVAYRRRVRCAGGWIALALLAGCVRQGDVLGLPGAIADAGVDDGAVPSPAILWRFDERAGGRVLDSSGSGALVHLRIEDAASVEWLDEALALRAPTRLVSERAPVELVAACRASSAITVEAWIVPAEQSVQGTRRIVSLSRDSGERNFTLAQGALIAEPAIDAYALRVRVATSPNGLPMLSTGAGSAQPRLTHVVAVHEAGGREVIYLDGAAVAEGVREGDFETWSDDYLFALGDEHGEMDEVRSWLGEYHLVAVYARALAPAEIAALHARGPIAR
jgi:hypothetical protein